MSPALAWWPLPPGVRARATGPDAEGFLQRMVTQDLRGMAVGEGRPACLTDRMGKLLAAFEVYRLPEGDFLLIGPAASRKGLLEKLPVYLLGTKAKLVEEPGTGSIGLQVGELPEPLGGEPAGEPLVGGLRTWNGFLRSATGPMPVRGVSRRGIGFPEIELVPERPVSTETWGALLGSGRQTDPDQVRALRVEAGIPIFGIDADESLMPTECGMGGSVAYNKGCYMGQEILERMRARKVVTRLLRRVVVETADVPQASDRDGLSGLPVLRDGKELGIATSAACSPGRGRVVALASLPVRDLEPGCEVSVAGIPARVESIEKGGAS